MLNEDVDWMRIARVVLIIGVLVIIAAGIRINEASSRQDIADLSHDQAQTAYESSVKQWGERLEGCQRVVASYADNARGWETQRRYIGRVTHAASVKSDVKHAAKDARSDFNVVVSRLKRRAAVNCRDAYPVPVTPPDVDPALAQIRVILQAQDRRERAFARCAKHYTVNCDKT